MVKTSDGNAGTRRGADAPGRDRSGTRAEMSGRDVGAGCDDRAVIFSGGVLVLIAAAVLILPGAALGYALGLRGRLLWGAATALTLGFTASAAQAYSALGIDWTPVAVLVGLVVTVAIAAGVTALVRRWRPQWYPATPRRTGTAVISAVGLGAAGLATAIMLAGTGRLTRIPQGWDSIMHGNAPRWIAITGDASPSALGPVVQPANEAYYYPDAFHAVVALILQGPRQAMPEALNAVVAATALVFILSIVALVQQIDARPRAVAAAAAAATAFSAFPFLPAGHGPLSPFALALAALPGALAVLWQLLRRVSAPPVPVLAVAVAGVFATHPSIAATGAILGVLAVLGRLLWGRRDRPTLIALAVTAVLTALVTAPQIDISPAGDVLSFRWPAVYSVPGALLRLARMDGIHAPAQWLLVALVVAGATAVVRRPGARPLLAGMAVFGFLFVAATTTEADWATRLTSLWWNDRSRLLEMYTVMAVPFAALGVARIGDVVGRRRPGRRAPVSWSMLVVLAVVSVAVYGPRNATLVERNFGGGPAVTVDERHAFSAFAEQYDGGAVMNDPYDGSPWLLGLESIPVLIPGMTVREPAIGADRLLLYERLDEFGDDPEVDAALERLDVRWVFVGSMRYGDRDVPPGFTGLADNPRFAPVPMPPGAEVYRVLR